MNDIVTLITCFEYTDELGFSTTTTTETEVYGQVGSVKRSEFYSALASKITLEAEIMVHLDDYLSSISKGVMPSKVKVVDSYTLEVSNYDIVRSFNDGEYYILYCKKGK